MLCSFIATVLGIGVTFGLSHFTEEKKREEVIKTFVFNVLSDLDNYENYLKKEDSIYSNVDWLPKILDRYYRNDSIQIDTLAKRIHNSFGFKSHFKYEFIPVGKEFLNQCQVNNVDDLETFRLINIAYEDVMLSYSFIEKMNSCVENLNREWLSMYYSFIRYSKTDVINKILSHESAHKLSIMINEKFILNHETLGFFDYYIKKIDYHRQRILLFAGTDMSEYMEFKEKRKQFNHLK